MRISSTILAFITERMIAFRPATAFDARLLAASMRPADRAEIEAGGFGLHEAIQRSLDTSEAAWAVCAGDELLGLFGTNPIGSPEAKVGAIWLLTTTAVESHALPFLRASRYVMKLVSKKYRVLLNFVDENHEAALKWVSWLGFRVYPPEPYGRHGAPFHPIVWIATST